MLIVLAEKKNLGQAFPSKTQKLIFLRADFGRNVTGLENSDSNLRRNSCPRGIGSGVGSSISFETD